MHLTNPFTNPPRLPSPAKRYSHTRSPSHSPARYRPRDFDPLLRDLSPTSTLRAFVSDPDEWTEGTSDVLMRSVLTSTISERALGAKAAQICLDVRSWTREMEHWQWPGTFEVPHATRRKARTSTLSFGTITSVIPDEEEEYWGSLPATTVQAYGIRADEIGQALDRIDVEELKAFVLSSHHRTDGGPAERGAGIGISVPMTDLKRLDDYTAVVTATTLQTLPYLSRLNRLLDLWTIRLIVLQDASSFVRDLQRARMDLDHGWAAIAVSSASTASSTSAGFPRKTMLEMKVLIERQVGSLGRRLDRFLDDLEGKEDTVPDAWIEDLDRLETAYGDWVVQAERRVLQNEWNEMRENEVTNAGEVGAEQRAQQHEVEVAHEPVSISDNDAAAQPSVYYPAQSLLESRPGGRKSFDSYIMHPRSADVSAVPNVWQADILPPRMSLSEERKSRNVPGVSSDSLTDMATMGKLSIHDGNSPEIRPTTLFSKTRAAFLGDIDRSSTLMKQSKSPVRPFEHASNAFTRLFKKDRSPEQAKPGAARSRSSPGMSSIKTGDQREVMDRPPVPSTVNANTKGGINEPESFPTAEILPESSDWSRRGRTTHYAEQELRLEALPPVPVLMPPKDIQRRRSSPKTNPPDILVPVVLSSPFSTPKEEEFPKDWPLSTSLQPSQDDFSFDPVPITAKADSEIYTPVIPLGTDSFDQMFVRNFPDSPSARPRSAREARAPVPWAKGHERARSMPRIKSKIAAVISKARGVEPRANDPADYHQMSSNLGLDKLPLFPPVPKITREGDSSQLAQATMLDRERTLASESFSLPDESVSPETSGFSHPETQRVEMHGTSVDLIVPHAVDASDIMSQGVQGNVSDVTSEDETPALLERASTTSVELSKGADVETTNVPGMSNETDPLPPDSPPRTPATSRPQTPAFQFSEKLPSSPMSRKSPQLSPTPLRNSRFRPGSMETRSETPDSSRHNTLPSSPADDQTDVAFTGTSGGKRAPLNAAMTKRRGKAPQKHGNHSPRVLTLSPSKKGAVFNPEGDSFDRHISEVLENLPSSIRFKTRPGAETPVSSTSEPRNYGAVRSKLSRAPTRANMTIAPADSPPKRSVPTSDNEVKVYHLTQTGSDETIKLFVRLVGESERVMVRVGGGWADLADYLRQYADHHGSRTVSEGTLEVQTVNGTASRRVSGAAEQKGKQPVTPIMDRPSGNEAVANWLHQPQPRFSMGDSTSSSDEAASAPIPRRSPSATTTPVSSATKGSRPSTSHTERPHSRQSASDVKLSGPSSGKRGQLSEHKEKWVEGMIEAAKQASGEKSTKEDSQKYFGELGKAGGTRRVIFRSSSAMSNRPSGGDKAK